MARDEDDRDDGHESAIQRRHWEGAVASDVTWSAPDLLVAGRSPRAATAAQSGHGAYDAEDITK